MFPMPDLFWRLNRLYLLMANPEVSLIPQFIRWAKQRLESFDRRASDVGATALFIVENTALDPQDPLKFMTDRFPSSLEATN